MDAAEITDYLAICELKARYCRLLDSKDWAGWGDLFEDDIELDTRPSGGTLVVGRAEVVKSVSEALANVPTAHQVHSPEIALHGDTADGIWAMQDRLVWAEPRAFDPRLAGMTGFGHYREHYVRRDGRWRIARQTLSRLHVDWHHRDGA